MDTISKPQVLVLMSTYNGERFLRPQLDSILAQQGVSLRLLVRDDGSTDGTLALLHDYQAERRLTLHAGQNLGPQRSFMQLLQHAPEADYYALADQDDFWQPDKLATAVGQLAPYAAQPALYAGQTQLADQDLRPIATPRVRPLCTFGESLVYAYASGCTMVMNHALQQKAAARRPRYVDMHDWWLTSFTLAVGGKVVFDAQPHMLYRQHEANVVGLHDSRAKEWRQRLHRILYGDQIRYRMGEELRSTAYADMPGEQQELLDLFLSAKHSARQRLRLLADPRFRAGHKKTFWLFKLAVLLNTY